MEASKRKVFIAGAWIAGICLALAVYLQGIHELWPHNPLFNDDAGKSYDQTFYISSAEGLAKGDTNIMPRSRMPVYPWIMHFLCDPARPAKEMLEVYMRLNVTISVICLGAIFLMLRRPLGTWLSCLVTLITAFRVFMFKAILVQPEILFYTLYLALFLLMLRCLMEPSWLRFAAAGLLAGVTHLTKGSALPMIGIFTMLAFIKCAGDWWRLRRDPARKGLPVMLMPALFLAGFFSVTGIYLYNSYREYGSPFYDPNTRYYFWAESPPEMTAMQKMGLAFGKPKLRPSMVNDDLVLTFMQKWAPDEALREEIMGPPRQGQGIMLEGKYDILPSFKHWMAAHTSADALDRIWDGLVGGESPSPKSSPPKPTPGLLHPGKDSVIGRNRDHSDGYWFLLATFFISTAIATVLATVFSAKKFWSAIAVRWLPAAFVLSSLVVPLLTYAWWAQISNRNRYFLTLYLPLLFVLGRAGRLACSYIPGRAKLHWRGRDFSIDACTAILIIMTVFCAYDFSDPLNRRNMRDPEDLARQIVQ